uniref:Predicted protein n=1 Tax=Physcomitrium patens TaxID=3218 RepID=A9U6J0_PHYPA
MIPTSGCQQIQSGNVSMDNYPQMADSNMKNVILQKSINATPLKAIVPTTMTPYFTSPTYQQLELFTNATFKDPNEALLLNLTNKMEELAMNLAKDKEKRHKPSNTRPNIQSIAQVVEEKNNEIEESPVHRVEVVQAVHIRSQQKRKRPIQYLNNAKAKGQLDPIMEPSNPSPDMGPLLNIRPESIVHLNEILIMEASISCQAVPFSM